MSDSTIRHHVPRLREMLADLMAVDAVFVGRNVVIVRGRTLNPVELLGQVLTDRVRPFGLTVEVEGTGEEVLVTLAAGAVGRRVPWTNIVLFVLTAFSMLLVGAYNRVGDGLLDDWGRLAAGIPYTGWFLAILLFHEFGHYIAARRHRMDVSLPYFIPLPTLLGTMGAVIRARSPFRNRTHLLDMAAAGPIAGFVVAVAALLIGLPQSTLIESAEAVGALRLGDPLIMKLASAIAAPPAPDGYDLLLSPIAFAGWAGLLVTMINLLPLGQLDGGHIIYALFGRHQRHIAMAAIAGLAVLSIWSPAWLLWVVIALLMGPRHPPTLFDERPLPLGRKIVGWVCVLIFAVTFIPVPIAL